jgi:hypothetical protein
MSVTASDFAQRFGANKGYKDRLFVTVETVRIHRVEVPDADRHNAEASEAEAQTLQVR